MPLEPGKIRNVTVVGHRGTGKTSLVEALLYQAGATNRLGTVESGSTVSDWDDDEQRRQMSLSASIANLEWHAVAPPCDAVSARHAIPPPGLLGGYLSARRAMVASQTARAAAASAMTHRPTFAPAP